MIIFSNRNLRPFVTPLPNIVRVDSTKILGVIIQNTLSMKEEHVAYVCQTAAQNIYALKLLKAHGMSLTSVSDVCRATVIARLTYAAPAWWGFANIEEKHRLQAIVNRTIRWGLYRATEPTIEQICCTREK